VEQAQFDGRPAEGLVRGDLAVDVVGGFVSSPERGKGEVGMADEGGLN